MNEKQLRRLIREIIILDIELGDVLLGGKWRNKKIIVKDIGVDSTGQPTINGKQILKFRIHKKQDKLLELEVDERQLRNLIRKNIVEYLNEVDAIQPIAKPQPRKDSLANAQNTIKQNINAAASTPDKEAIDNIFNIVGPQIKQAIQTVTPDLKDKTSQEVQAQVKTENKEQINELGVLALVGLAAALPKLSELAGKTINLVYGKLCKLFTGTTEQKTLAFGNWLTAAGKGLHRKYIKGISMAIKLAMPKGTDEKYIDKISSVIYFIIIGALGVFSGMGAISALDSAAHTTAGFEAGLAAIKSGEVLSALSKLQFAAAFSAAMARLK